MAERSFRPPAPRAFGARRGPIVDSDGVGSRAGLLPEAAAEHEPGLLAAEAAAAYRWIAPAAGGRDVCEIGCGPGEGAAVAIEAGASSYVGVDSDERMIERAKRAHGGRASFLRGEPTAVPLSSGAYELVICLRQLDPSTDLIGLLTQVRRLLSEEGIAAITLPTAPAQDPIGGGTIDHHRSPAEWEGELRESFAEVRVARRRTSFGTTVFDAYSEPETIDEVRWLGAEPGEERAIIALVGDSELPALEPVASLVGGRDLRDYQQTIAAWEHRARRAEAEGAAKHWELVASREAQRRLRKRLWHLEHTPVRRLLRVLRGKPARLGEGPPIRPPEGAPERWE
ncbi:MAG: class I SAM-dependent DNA methyltransferase [Solirubrobacterales bacterium]